MDTTTTKQALDAVRAAHPGILWHTGTDPVNDHFPAWRAVDDATGATGIIRVGKRDFSEPGFEWVVGFDAFTWSDYTDTLEQALDAATDRLIIAPDDLMLEGF